MAERNVAVRIAVVDGQRVKAELVSVGEAGQKALGQIEKGARPASEGLEKVARSAEHAGKSASLLGDLSHAMAGFVGGLAAGAVEAGINFLGQIPQALSAIVREAQLAADSQRGLENALRVSGYTAGLTAEQILDYSEKQEAATLNTAESIQDAAAILATFRTISGETFTRTLSLAQDLSAVFKQDLKSSVVQLGKALENPTNGMTALSRVGVTFTDDQKEVIKTLQETGRQLEAQQELLAAIERQGVLGAAAAQAEGVSGAVSRFSDAWGNMLEALGQTPAMVSVAQGALNILSSGLEGIAAEASGAANTIEARLARARETLAAARQYKKDHPILSRFSPIDAEAVAEREVRELEKPAQENLRIQLLTQEAEEKQAAAAAEKMQVELKTNAVLEEQKKLEAEIGKLKKEPGEKAAKVREDLAATRTRLENQRTPETSGEVDRALAQAEELAKRKLQLIDEEVSRAAAAERSKGESAARAAERAAEAHARATERKIQEDERYRQAELQREEKELAAVARLEDAHAQLTSTQMGNIDLILQRQLEANAREIETIAHREAADIAATKRAEAEKSRLREETLTGIADELARARAGTAEARARDPELKESERTQAAQEGMEIRIQLEREETERRIEALRMVGLGEEDFARARLDLVAIGEEKINEILSRSNREKEQGFISAERVATQFNRTLSSGLTELVLQGKEGFDSLSDAFQSFLDGVQRQLIQSSLEAVIGGPGTGGAGGTGILGAIMGAFAGGASAGGGGSGGGGSLLSLGAGGNSITGGTASFRTQHSGGFWYEAPLRTLPRLHSGLGPNEYTAVLDKSEGVFTQGQMRALAPANSRPTLNVIINNNSSEQVSTKQTPDGNLQIDIGNIVANALSKPGSPANQMVRGMIQSEMRSGG